MTGGTNVATAHGPWTEDAVNHTPFCTAYQASCDTMIIGVGALTTYMSGVSGTGLRSGVPLINGVNEAVVRETVAVCGMSLAMTASCACGVCGTAALTFSLGLSSGIWAKSGGRFVPATYCHGPAKSDARNQRPVTRT